MMKAIIFCIGAFFFTACNDYPVETIEPQKKGEVNLETKVLPKTEPVDILFVIDNSGSMAEEQTKLRTAFNDFIKSLQNYKTAYQIGATITDLRLIQADSYGQKCDRFYSNFKGGCLIQSNSGRKIITSTDDFQTQIKEFTEMTDVGTCGSTWEQGLEAAKKAIEQSTDTSCMYENDKPFMRPDANLIIIFLTDEEDCSHTSATQETVQLASDPGPQGAYQQCYMRNNGQNNLIPVDEYINFFKAYKGEGKVKFALISGSKDGASKACYFNAATNQVSDQCSEAAIFQGCPKDDASCVKCLAAKGERYEAVARGMGTGNFAIASICDSSYVKTMVEFVESLIPPDKVILPEKVANSESLTVRKRRSGSSKVVEVPRCEVQNETCKDGWFLEADQITLRFRGAYILNPNEDVEVFYMVE